MLSVYLFLLLDAVRCVNWPENKNTLKLNSIKVVEVKINQKD